MGAMESRITVVSIVYSINGWVNTGEASDLMENSWKKGENHERLITPWIFQVFPQNATVRKLNWLLDTNSEVLMIGSGMLYEHIAPGQNVRYSTDQIHFSESKYGMKHVNFYAFLFIPPKVSFAKRIYMCSLCI